MTVKECLEAYREHHLEQVVDQKRVLISIGHLLPFWADKKPEKIRPADFADYRAGRKAAPATVNRELAVLSAALKFAYRHGWITVSPYVPRVKEVPRVHWMRPETAQWLLEAAKPVRHLYAYILISLHSGQRKDAVLGLTWDRVDWESNVIRFTDPHLVCAHRRKNRATVPISATLRELLLELREEAGTSPYVINYAGTRLQDIRHAWRKAIKAAEISGKHTPHGLRHSVATNLLRSGRTLLEVSKLLGHRDSSITERVYGHFEPDFVQDSVNQLDHLFGAQQL